MLYYVLMYVYLLLHILQHMQWMLLNETNSFYQLYLCIFYSFMIVEIVPKIKNINMNLLNMTQYEGNLDE